MRRFIEANEAKRFANKRFAVNLNKHFNYCINEEITKLIKRFNSYINCQVNEKTTKSKVANIDY